jgi:hypothetical protein
MGPPRTPTRLEAPTLNPFPGRRGKHTCFKPYSITESFGRAKRMSKALHQILEIEDAEALARLSETSVGLRETSLSWLMSSERDVKTQLIQPGSVRTKRRRPDYTKQIMDWKPRPLAEAATAPGDELGVIYNEEIKSSHSHPFSGYLGTDSSSPTLPTVDCSCTQSPRYTLELCNLPWKQQKTACSHSTSLPLNFTIDSYNCTCKAPLLPT